MDESRDGVKLPFSQSTKSYTVINDKIQERKEAMITDSVEQAVLDPVMVSFKSLLIRQLGCSLKEVWLFGSRARGDFHKDSDYDVIVVAEGQLKQLRAIVADANYRILDEYQELVGSIVYTPELWERSKHGPLGMNVKAQGIRIA